ncbi:hypothetical protein [Shewanella sp.]|uniref:hypothetical protein n=1 Tax=Shewanella sp. TaxID=50422 RepID=UPI003A983FA6
MRQNNSDTQPVAKIQTAETVSTKAKIATKAQVDHEHAEDGDMAVVEKETDSKAVAESDDLLSDYDFYFTQPDISQILENLKKFHAQISPQLENSADKSPGLRAFPSICLIGLGRCGSNIATDVALLVHDARNFYLNEFLKKEELNTKKVNKPSKPSGGWLQRGLKLHSSGTKPVFLIEPLVMLGDLDKDIEGRVRYSSNGRGRLLEEYHKLKIMNFSEVHAGGAGNAPILGQYLAKIILNKDTEHFSNPDWPYIHSYLVDSCGIRANQSRLYFYIFSAGGGTGSGMASEFGLAQQHSYIRKTFDIRPESDLDGQNQSFVFEPIFTSGFCILPTISAHLDMSEALHINAGRLLCKYLAEEWNFSYNPENDNDDTYDVAKRIRPWNAMMLISNDIMSYAEQSNDDTSRYIDVNSMEKYANQYISQQIFNILSAQAVTSDYDENYFRRAGINIGETIRLDANDLFMSLAGPVATAYAESVVPDNAGVVDLVRRNDQGKSGLDIDDLFCRSIDLPHFNAKTQAIEGISLLPVAAQQYRTALGKYRESGFDAEYLKSLCFFNSCSSVVCIVSLPKDYKLSYVDLNKLKTHLNNLFPNTTLKRYALVVGASANLSLTTLIAKSPCMSDDFLTLVVAYIKRCFAKKDYCYSDNLEETILDCIRSPEFDESRIDEMLEEFENPSKILDTNWHAIKPMYEKKYRELIRDSHKFTSINDIRLSRESVKNAIKYLREIYRHRVSKTKMVSLNSYSNDK